MLKESGRKVLPFRVEQQLWGKAAQMTLIRLQVEIPAREFLKTAKTVRRNETKGKGLHKMLLLNRNQFLKL
jgi:hypothetical protein